VANDPSIQVGLDLDRIADRRAAYYVTGTAELLGLAADRASASRGEV